MRSTIGMIEPYDFEGTSFDHVGDIYRFCYVFVPIVDDCFDMCDAGRLEYSSEGKITVGYEFKHWDNPTVPIFLSALLSIAEEQKTLIEFHWQSYCLIPLNLSVRWITIRIHIKDSIVSNPENTSKSLNLTLRKAFDNCAIGHQPSP